MRRGRVVVSFAAAALIAAFAAPMANAAFPGANGKIAFSAFDDEAGAPVIHTVNPDGSGLTPITDGGTGIGDTQPAWSPDGGRIVFVRTIFTDFPITQIWVMNADGSGQTELPSGSEGLDPAFSADGQSIYFSRQEQNEDESFDREIFVMPATPTADPGTKLTNNLDDDFEPSASADGQLVAFTRDNTPPEEPPEVTDQSEASTSSFTPLESDVWTMAPSGGGETNITNDPELDDEAPNFSPDSATIVYARTCASITIIIGPPIIIVDEASQTQENGECDTRGLARIPAGGGTAVPITTNSSSEGPFDDWPAIAPDGSQVAFERSFFSNGEINGGIEPRDHGEAPEIRLVPFAGGATQFVAHGLNPDWGPRAAAPALSPAPAAGVGVVAKRKRLPRCFGRKATILGTKKSEKIVGTPGDDVIKGRKGKDRIFGKGGDDVICGARAKDKIFGNKGDDILIGGSGPDFLKGGSGADKLFGGTPKAPFKPPKNTCVDDPEDQLKNCHFLK